MKVTRRSPSLPNSLGEKTNDLRENENETRCNPLQPKELLERLIREPNF